MLALEVTNWLYLGLDKKTHEMVLFIPIFEHDQYSNYFTLSMGLEISNSTIVEWQQNYTYTSYFSFARALRVVICSDYMYTWSICTVYLVSFPVDCT